MAGIFDFLIGSSGGYNKLDTMSPEQQEFFQNMFQQLGQGGQLGQAYGQAMGGLQDWLDPSSEAYSRMADPYMRQFEQETVPGLAERFAGAGAMGGGLSSSGFGQSLSSAAGNLQSNLASMKTQMQRQAMGDIMNQYNQMSQLGMSQQPFAYGYQPPQAGLIPQMVSGYAGAGFPGLGQAWNAMTGGNQRMPQAAGYAAGRAGGY